VYQIDYLMIRGFLSDTIYSMGDEKASNCLWSTDFLYLYSSFSHR